MSPFLFVTGVLLLLANYRGSCRIASLTGKPPGWGLFRSFRYPTHLTGNCFAHLQRKWSWLSHALISIYVLSSFFFVRLQVCHRQPFVSRKPDLLVWVIKCWVLDVGTSFGYLRGNLNGVSEFLMFTVNTLGFSKDYYRVNNKWTERMGYGWLSDGFPAYCSDLICLLMETHSVDFYLGFSP